MSGSASHSCDEAAEPERLQRAVDQPRRLQQQPPHDRRDHLGQHEREEEEQPEQRAAAHALVEQHGEPEGERQLQDQRQGEDHEDVAQRGEEHRVGQRVAVVLQPDEVGRAARGRSSRSRCSRRPGRSAPATSRTYSAERRQQEADDRRPLPPRRPDAADRPGAGVPRRSGVAGVRWRPAAAPAERVGRGPTLVAGVSRLAASAIVWATSSGRGLPGVELLRRRR